MELYFGFLKRMLLREFSFATKKGRLHHLYTLVPSVAPRKIGSPPAVLWSLSRNLRTKGAKEGMRSSPPPKMPQNSKGKDGSGNNSGVFFIFP